MRKFKIELDEFDLGQLLDGLETRAATWEKTAVYHRTGEANTRLRNAVTRQRPEK